MQIKIVIPLILYFIVVFILSFYAYLKRRKTSQLAHFFIGNRTLNGFFLAMTLVTTYVSASSFIGGPGAAYKYGLGWVLLAMIQVPTVWLSLGILGKKFAILAKKYNAITLNDMLYARYKSRTITFIASFCLITAFFGAMTVQFIGGARLLETAIGLPYSVGLIIIVIVTSLYTAIGGFHAGILNDALQGIIMLVGSILLLIAAIYTAGGLPQAMATIKSIDPKLLTPQGANDFLTPPFVMSFWVLICFGVVGLPHTAVRCMAYNNSKAVHQGMIIGTIVITLLMFTMHFSGVLSRAIIPDLTIPDRAIPALMIKILPPFVAGIFLAAPLAAIMSTINAQLLQTSSVLIKDLYLEFKPNSKIQNETRLTQISSIITFLIGLLLMLAAWRPPEMIIWLNLLSFGGLQAVFLWPLVLGLYWSRANASGAIASMCCGAICYIILTLFNINIFGFHPIVPTLLLGLMAFYLTTLFSTNKNKPVSHNQ